MLIRPIKSFWMNAICVYKKKQDLYILVLLLSVGIFIRLFGYAARDIWFDEAITLSKLIDGSFWQALNPPLYFILLSGWMKLFGLSVAAMRALSVTFSVATILVVYMIGKKCFNKKIGLLAAAITAVSPFQIWYAHEVRAYALLGFICACALLSVVLYAKHNSIKHAFFLMICSIAGLYTHPYYVLFFVSQLLTLLFVYKAHRLAVVSIGILSFISWLPSVHSSLQRFNNVCQGYWIPRLDFKSIISPFINGYMGYTYTLLMYVFAIGVLLFLLSTVSVIAFKKMASVTNNIKALIMFCTVPIVLNIAISLVCAPIYIDRGFQIIMPAYYIILAAALFYFPRNFRKYMVMIFFALPCIGLFYYNCNYMPLSSAYHRGVYLKKPVGVIAEYILDRKQQGDVVMLVSDSVAFPFLWYYAGPQGLKRYWQDGIPYFAVKDCYACYGDAEISASHCLPRMQTPFDIPLHKIKELPFKRMWAVACNWQRSGVLDSDALNKVEYLKMHYCLIEETEIHGARVYCFERI